MTQSEARQILDFVASFQTKAQAIKRYVGNPYVQGDNIAEHLARLAKLLVCLAPELKQEFPDQPALVEMVTACLLVHDDDEVIDGFDIPTALKSHNIKDEEEISRFENFIAELPEATRQSLLTAFSAFRRRDSLPARIAKALDNIAGNQLVIEQQIGLVNPDQARFAIEYVEKVRGASKVIDAMISAQVEEIIEIRERWKNNLGNINLPADKAMALLAIDIRTHILNKAKINLPLEKL